MRQRAQDFDVQIRFQHPFPFLTRMLTLHQKGRQHFELIEIVYRFKCEILAFEIH